LPVWNLGSMAEFFLELLLKFQPELSRSFERTSGDRCAFQTELAALPEIETVYPSGGNFVLVRLAGSGPEAAAALCDRLLREHSIYIKDVSAKFGNAGPYLRLAVRKPVDNQQLLSALSGGLA
jgi:histidinol-phosphate/aromatic aminotransferase/cobyric acid decarboxylase-like protein